LITPATAALFFALLMVLANLAVAAAVVLAVASRFSPGAARLLGEVRDQLAGPNALWAAWTVAAVATAGSLYFSEVAGYPPCRLCWYQRIGMYPLAVILAVAALRADVGVRRYAVPLAVLTMPVSVWHMVLERYPSLESGVCDPLNPCSLVWVRELGYGTLPTMALSAFALIVTLLLLARPAPVDTDPEFDGPPPVPAGVGAPTEEI
jgi:disulfide bond formation protein DsbB